MHHSAILVTQKLYISVRFTLYSGIEHHLRFIVYYIYGIVFYIQAESEESSDAILEENSEEPRSQYDFNFKC